MKRVRRRSQRGITLLEVMISTALLVSVLGSALGLLDASNDLAQSVNDERAAAMRVDRALGSIADEFRKGSLATATHLDDTTFSDGDTGVGFKIRPIEGWNGATIQGAEVSYEFTMLTGAADGDLIRREGAIVTTLARGITAFAVSRTGNSFTFTIDAGSGRNDDRRRRASGSLQVMARNP